MCVCVCVFVCVGVCVCGGGDEGVRALYWYHIFGLYMYSVVVKTYF